MFSSKLKWSFLIFISFNIYTCYSQDKIHFYKGEILEVKILEVGTDSIQFLTKPGKKRESQRTISNHNVSFLEYSNGQRHFISRDVIVLQNKTKLVTILEVGEEYITYIDLLDKYYEKPKVFSKKEIIRITFSNGEIKRFYDVIYLSNNELILGHVEEVDVNKIIYINIDGIKNETDLSQVNQIIFKNGIEQKFGDSRNEKESE